MFGVTLAQDSRFSAIGALCEMTHFIPVPEKKRIFISARVVSRFRVSRQEDVISSKPFLAARASVLVDSNEGHANDGYEHSVWQDMIQVRNLASKLYSKDGSGLGDDAFNLEVRRWAPDQSVRKSVQSAVGSHPGMMDAVKRAGLLGNYEQEEEYLVAKRPSRLSDDDAVEFISTEAKVDINDDARRERFSFALVNSLDFSQDERHHALHLHNSTDRLKMAHEKVNEGLKYLVARSALDDIL